MIGFILFVILMLAAIVGLPAVVFIMLRRANSWDEPPRRGDEERRVVDTGSSVLSVVLITIAIGVAFLVILFGTCMSTLRL
jgi:hypothetical protein